MSTDTGARGTGGFPEEERASMRARADKERYSTFGFTSEAVLDEDGGLWPTSYAVTEVDEETGRAIAALVRKAVG